MTPGKGKLLLFATIYSFFICFLFVCETIIQNIFGWVLSYRQMTYEWKVLNIHEARKEVFYTALIHFGIFLACCLCYFNQIRKTHSSFKEVKGH